MVRFVFISAPYTTGTDAIVGIPLLPVEDGKVEQKRLHLRLEYRAWAELIGLAVAESSKSVVVAEILREK